MDLGEALAWLDGHVNLEASPAVAGRVEGLSLDRMRALCHVLGDPQHAQPSLHLTGTNGKGSVARLLTALLTAHDLRVGTYTSPHLERVNERIALDGEPIGDAALAAVLSDLASLEGLLEQRPSYFELLTAAALRWWAEEAAEVAVVEVGLLGRWDATNVVDGDVAVVTNVAADHTDGAPGWRARVAEEKCGIVKEGALLVLGEGDPELLAIAASTPAREVLVAGRDFACTSDRLAVGGRVLTVRTPHERYDELFVPLHGPHQAANAAVAIVATEAFLGRAIGRDSLDEALASATLPGRFEVVGRQPLVVLDGAHNEAGGAALAATLVEGFAPGGAVHLVVGMLSGRSPEAFLRAVGVGPGVEVVACSPDSPRALPAQELGMAVAALGGSALVVPDVGEAIAAALDGAGVDDVVVVTGSLYTVGAARAIIRTQREHEAGRPAR